jgi:hypothetical protein
MALELLGEELRVNVGIDGCRDEADDGSQEGEDVGEVFLVLQHLWLSN